MKNTILVVDDEEVNRELLRQIFESDYVILQAQSGNEALDLLRAHSGEIVVVLLDLIMPEIGGYQVLQLMNTEPEMAKIPVVIVTADMDQKNALSCYALGAKDIINKPFMPQLVRKRVENIVENYRSQELQEETLLTVSGQLAEKEKQLRLFGDKLIETVGNLVEFRNIEDALHVKRIKGLTMIMAQTYQNLYPEDGLTDEEIEFIVRGAVLHDLGKIAVPDAILHKPGEYTAEEIEVLKSHTTKGCEVLSCIEDERENHQYQVTYDICRHHHEKYDGSGYPDGLVGDEIPLSAQLVAMADLYDTLVSERVYKKAYTKQESYNIITGERRNAFSPKILRCFEMARKPMELFIDTHQ